MRGVLSTLGEPARDELFLWHTNQQIDWLQVTLEYVGLSHFIPCLSGLRPDSICRILVSGPKPPDKHRQLQSPRSSLGFRTKGHPMDASNSELSITMKNTTRRSIVLNATTQNFSHLG
jgi:hypothetical protein